jgi:hypothetical protein
VRVLAYGHWGVWIGFGQFEHLPYHKILKDLVFEDGSPCGVEIRC